MVTGLFSGKRKTNLFTFLNNRLKKNYTIQFKRTEKEKMPDLMYPIKSNSLEQKLNHIKNN